MQNNFEINKVYATKSGRQLKYRGSFSKGYHSFSDVTPNEDAADFSHVVYVYSEKEIGELFV
jgi:hypothetical protein